MSIASNRKIVLVKRPQGAPTPDCFDVVEEAVDAPAEGRVVVAVEHLSIDAFIRTTLEEGGIHQTSAMGAPITALGVGRVVASSDERLQSGTAVFGPLGAQTHAVLPAPYLRPLDESLAPARAYLGVLGLTTGITSWVGMKTVGEVRAGETVVVSAAAGAVGSVACEIARLEGARVIGIAGGPDKVRYLTEDLGCTAGIDYKGEDVASRLKALAPDGVKLFFDNVGGELLDTVLDQLAPGARVVICGAISQYQHLSDVRGPKLYLRLAERNSSMRGFTVDHYASVHEQAQAELAAWLNDGALHLREHIVEGIDHFPGALDTLFSGGHIGKLLVVP